jgi:hypothetical protein
MRKLPLHLTALLVLTALLASATQASAMVSSTVDAKLATSGEITIHGNSTINGLEARMVRGAIDSPANNTAFFYTLGTGNGDGYVNGTEAKAYADKALKLNLLKSAFDLHIINVTEDGYVLPATLKAMDFPDASGAVSSGSPLNITFDVSFKAQFHQDKDTHKYVISFFYSAVSYKVKFSVPQGWNIGQVSGVKDKDIVNGNQGSFVTGSGGGGETKVAVEVKKTSDWCCLVLGMGLVILILVVVYFIFQRYKKSREVTMSQPEYVQVQGAGPVEACATNPPKDGAKGPGGDKGAGIERRISEDQRTFGKDYHKEGKGGKEDD